MPLDVLGVGFGRTGTNSLRLALNRLGYPCYHMFEVLDNPSNRPHHLDFWLEVARSEPGTQHDWERVFANYRATVDNPAAGVWRELHEAYPEAKVLLSLHPKGPQAWYRSTWETIHQPQRMWQNGPLRRWLPMMRKMDEMSRRLIWTRFHRETMSSEAASVQRYENHIAEVREAIPADQLLVYDVSQGWEPLCRFLDEPVPDEPFPRTNERAEMRRRIRGFKLAGAAFAALEIGIVVLLLWLAMRWLF